MTTSGSQSLRARSDLGATQRDVRYLQKGGLVRSKGLESAV